MSKPIAVLISDVHYSLPTLELADKAVRMAIDKANDLEVPLIVAGDLHDTKANLRGECVKAMIQTFKHCVFPPYVLIGNHDRINEKSTEHSLNFLEGYCKLVSEPLVTEFGRLLPYHHDPEELKSYLGAILKGSTLIMHQGVQTSNSGHYIHDKSALPKECFADFRVISGHYHTRQDIRCGRPMSGAVGLYSYIGNPYTLNFGEANDPPKGFQILHDNGSLEFVPTNLRKHIVITYDLETNTCEWSNVRPAYRTGDRKDLFLVKVSGKLESLNSFDRQVFARDIGIPNDFRLDLIPLESKVSKPKLVNQSQPEILDGLIDSLTNTSDEQKTRVKTMWKGL